MNADFLAMLGGSGPSSAPTRRDEGKSIVKFKAGKMTAERMENGKYLVSPDPRRGIIDMKWTANGSSGSSGAGNSGGLLKLEWMDRRTNAIVDSLTIFPEDNCTYSKADTGREGDRVYLLQYGNNSERRFFFWMQEKEEGNEDEDNCVKINMCMADPAEAAALANGTSTEGNNSATSDTSFSNTSSSRTEQATLDELASLTMNGLNSNSTGSSNNADGARSSTSRNDEQVDLSRLLSSTTANATSTNASPEEESKEDNPTTTGGLTLLDLQGAMAGLATTSPAAASAAQIPGPPLDELASPSSVIEAGILNDEAVKARLIELLPVGQRSEEKLMENIRSPQVAQCLKSLTAALCDDEGGSIDNFSSILANFQLDTQDGALSMAAGNPIQAFLDCVLKSIEKEKKSKSSEEEKEDTEMSED